MTWRKAGAQDEAKPFAQLMCNFIYLYVFAFFITNQSALALNVTHVNPMVELEVKTESCYPQDLSWYTLFYFLKHVFFRSAGCIKKSKPPYKDMV